jgi:hypothetical protein
VKKELAKKSAVDERTLEGGIEWIVARQLVPIQDELFRLRAYVEALSQANQPW